MFIAACEGYFDKENDHSRIARLQTFYQLRCAGAKISRPEDLWLLEGERRKEADTFIWGSKEDMEKLKADIEKAHGIKLN